jgi:hypothetical protein
MSLVPGGDNYCRIFFLQAKVLRAWIEYLAKVLDFNHG